MRKRALVPAALAIAAAAGCNKHKTDASGEPPGEAAAPATADLWKLAPEGTQLGLVVAEGAGADLHRGFIAVAEPLETMPAAAGALAAVRKARSRYGFDLMDVGVFATAGIDLARPMAVFVANDTPYLVLPVSDRAAFSSRFGGKRVGAVDRIGEWACRVETDRYLCATSQALEAWRPARHPIDAGWPVSMRGSIELQITGDMLVDNADLAGAITDLSSLRAAVNLERGGALVRYSIAGRPTMVPRAIETPLADAAIASGAAGLFVGNLDPMIAGFREGAAGALDQPGPGGFTLGQIADSLTGELVVFGPAGGPTRGFLEVGLADPAPVRALLPTCGSLPLPTGIAARPAPGGCTVTVSGVAANVPTLREIEIDLEVSGRALVARVGGGDRESDGGIAVPSYFTERRWLAAFLVRGLIATALAENLGESLAEEVRRNPFLALGLWGLTHVTEIGAGVSFDETGVHGFVRLATTWANPDPVIAAFEPLATRFASGDLSAVADIAALADRHPESPLATSADLGTSGAVAAVIPFGALAATAIPAFRRYINRSKATEARLMLRDLAERAAAIGPRAGKTGITPSLGTCCQSPKKKCAPDPDRWRDPLWTALEFSIDEPHYYSYQIEVAGDGSFSATAHGDLDCDGVYSSFEIRGTRGREGIEIGELRIENEVE
jgi:hypothetical protein